MQTIFECKETWTERQQRKLRAHPVRSTLAALILLLALVSFYVYRKAVNEQRADPDFNARVAAPAYVNTHPKVIFDEAHYNFHTATGRYKPLADLLRNDGYEIISNRQRFRRESLDGCRVLVIANALGAKGLLAMAANLAGVRSALQWELGALTPEERNTVGEWVRAGGSLLLIADHAPAGNAVAGLAERFGVQMSNLFTEDAKHPDPATDVWTFIVYNREAGLVSHPITEGRSPAERINQVITFTGQSLKGPPGSVPFLSLSPTAEDYPTLNSKQSEGGSAAGRAQGVALTHGEGRIVVLGEAAMLTAQVFEAGGRAYRFGMEYPGYENRQLALNIMHWLSRMVD